MIKHASDLLDDIWKQIYYHRLQSPKPNLRIWMNRVDIATLVQETDLIPRDANLIVDKVRVTKLFGYDLYSADDTSIGEPIVELAK